MRWTQFSLRSFFATITLLCIVLGWATTEGRRRTRTILALKDAKVMVEFRHRLDGNTYYPNAQPPGSPVLKWVLGEYYASKVLQIETWNPELFADEQAAQVSLFKELDWINIQGTKITDTGLSQIATMKRLGRLDIEGCPVSERAVIELRRALPNTKIYSDYD